MEYDYENITESPDLDAITLAISVSAMTDKNLDYLRWDESIATLHVAWQDELSAGDKAILDQIVADNT